MHLPISTGLGRKTTFKGKLPSAWLGKERQPRLTELIPGKDQLQQQNHHRMCFSTAEASYNCWKKCMLKKCDRAAPWRTLQRVFPDVEIKTFKVPNVADMKVSRQPQTFSPIG
jgi:hypothetical protein